MRPKLNDSERSETVSYRLPLSVVEIAQTEARRRQVRLSVILREATVRGLAVVVKQ